MLAVYALSLRMIFLRVSELEALPCEGTCPCANDTTWISPVAFLDAADPMDIDCSGSTTSLPVSATITVDNGNQTYTISAGSATPDESACSDYFSQHRTTRRGI